MENVKTQILLVEDDPNLGTLLQEYLEAKGFETKLATDGKKGFDAFCKQEFDLLLLDVMMPVKDGLTLAKEIRVTDKHVPIIFSSSQGLIFPIFSMTFGSMSSSFDSSSEAFKVLC